MKQNSVSTPLKFFAPSHWPTWIGLGTMWCISQLPGAVRRKFGRWIGAYVLKRNKKRAEIVNLNLSWAFPELSDGQRATLARKNYGFSGQMIIDYGFCWWSSARRFDEAVEFEGLEEVQALLDSGEPVILITGHALALDIGGVSISRQLPMVTYANRMRNPLVQWMMERGRRRFGMELLQRESGMRPLIKSLKNGRLLYYVIDEDMEEHSVFAPYFGVAKATLTVPARVAKMTRAKVAPCFTFFDEQRGKYVVRIGALLDNFPTGDDLKDAITTNQALEHDISQNPSQYMWTQRLYKTRPDGSPPPYTMNGRAGSGPRARPE